MRYQTVSLFVILFVRVWRAFMETAIKKWHRQQAKKLAKQMPEHVDDALSVLECLADIVERRHQIVLRDALENAPVSRLPRA
jgi:hypothetical protein